MLIVMTSPAAVLLPQVPNPQIVAALKAIRAQNNPVALISNHGKPIWFDPTFQGSGVQFLREFGRQNGKIVSNNAQKFGLNPFDTIVLASKGDDVQMGKNGGALLVAAGWSKDPVVTALGIRVDSPQQLQQVINLTAGWKGQWWFAANGASYGVRALANLSSYYQPVNQQQFSDKVTATVKGGGVQLTALLTVAARSLLIDGVGAQKDLVWGVYPSSNSANNDDEVLSDFTHRLRTTVSKVRYSKRGVPLFIRHTLTAKRSSGGQNRLDPADQLLTLHLNPEYKGAALKGKHVIVVDDCLTYGASFGVASAFLRRAGAASVTGVALGKFGNKLHEFDIQIDGDPFAPLTANQFSVKTPKSWAGASSDATQQILLNLIP